MARHANPSELEAAVVSVLWETDDLTAKEIHERLNAARPAPYPATLATLARLTDKRLVGAVSNGTDIRYVPLVHLEDSSSPHICRATERLSRFSAWSLAARFVSRRSVTELQLAELRRLIDTANAQ